MDIVITEQNRRSNPLSGRIKLVQGNIAQQDVDAIISLIPQNLEYRGQVNNELLKDAGEQLDEFILENIYKPRVGDVYAVPGFGLPCEHVLFGITPDWRNDFDREDGHLLKVLRKTLELARGMGLTRIALPPLASGKNGFPKQRAARLIVQAIENRLDEDFDEIRIVCVADRTLRVFEERLQAVGWTGMV
ncbi:MAG: hypothetical protein DHS20C02_10020 [Micavibrio sp.]|nr:MAG: hypothetical protein DHS20C02_10020 [Micavibrio sp.]